MRQGMFWSPVATSHVGETAVTFPLLNLLLFAEVKSHQNFLVLCFVCSVHENGEMETSHSFHRSAVLMLRLISC